MKLKCIHAYAPLRIGLAGGGTDVSPFCDIYGGAVLNTAINIYAHAHVEPLKEQKIIFNSVNKSQSEEWPIGKPISTLGNLRLLKAAYTHLLEKFSFKEQGLIITLKSDVAVRSGLGSSSSCLVALIAAISTFHGIHLEKMEIAKLAFQVERKELSISGGAQDQYAAAIGGTNYLTFGKNEKVEVEHLHLKNDIISKLQENLILYSTNLPLLSKNIMDEQIKKVKVESPETLNALFELKDQASKLRELLLKGNVSLIAELLSNSWKAKQKLVSDSINPQIQLIIDKSLNAGATAAKVSGAGGGSFMVFYCEKDKIELLTETLRSLNGEVKQLKFEADGVRVEQFNYLNRCSQKL